MSSRLITDDWVTNTPRSTHTHSPALHFNSPFEKTKQNIGGGNCNLQQMSFQNWRGVNLYLLSTQIVTCVSASLLDLRKWCVFRQNNDLPKHCTADCLGKTISTMDEWKNVRLFSTGDAERTLLVVLGAVWVQLFICGRRQIDFNASKSQRFHVMCVETMLVLHLPLFVWPKCVIVVLILELSVGRWQLCFGRGRCKF